MKYYLDMPIVGLDGEALPSRAVKSDPRSGQPLEKPEDVPALTLRMALIEALLRPQQDDASTPGLAYTLFTLAERCKSKSAVEFEAYDITLLKERVEKTWGVLVVGRVWSILEKRDEPEPRAE